MHFYKTLFLLAHLFIASPGLIAQSYGSADSIFTYQTLINGRLWRYEHTGIKGNPFLITDKYLPGIVITGNKKIPDLTVRYDIYEDEIMIPFDRGILQLNKERIDSFTIIFSGKPVQFIRIPEKTRYPFSGYVRNVYSGRTALYIKYQKKIDRPGIANMPDNFYQLQRMYLINDSTIYPVKSRRDFFLFFGEHESQVKSFIRENNIHYSRRDPSTYVPVLKFFDSFK